MKAFKSISLNHHNCPLSIIGEYQLEQGDAETLNAIKSKFQIEELLYLNTCNRVELLLYADHISEKELPLVFKDLNPEREDSKNLNFEIYSGKEAVRHWFKVSSSLKSLVVGEREIFGQCRNAFEFAKSSALAGDKLRVLNRFSVECAKEVYTETAISTKPISVVYLAFKSLKDKLKNLADKRILLYGFGQTNQTMIKFLIKENCKNISIANRSVYKAKIESNCEYPVYSLENVLSGSAGVFDIVIACTASTIAQINEENINLFWSNEKERALVDLALPSDYSAELHQRFSSEIVCIEDLKELSAANLAARKKELVHCEAIIDKKLDEFKSAFAQRKIERALCSIPEEVAKIKQRAINDVFAKDLSQLNPEQLAIMEKMMDYMEKKCVAIPMRVAKEKLLD